MATINVSNADINGKKKISKLNMPYMQMYIDSKNLIGGKILHKVTMMVNIPDEEWESFKEIIKESGSVQFKFRNATIFAKIF